MSNLSAKYTTMPTVSVTTVDGGCGGSKEQHNDVITLNAVRNENEFMNEETIETTTSRPTTPIPMRKFSASKRPNLNLKILTAEDTSRTSPSSSSSSSAHSTKAESRGIATTVFSSREQYQVSKRLDIDFSNITYNVNTGFFKREIKNILNGLTGQFHAGELSAIVGPSGAGKSTLLNILSSYKPYGFSGDITVNGHARDIKTFKPNIAFIMQDTSLQPYLTVNEAMHFSANLKIGQHMNKNEKRSRVRTILEAIGLYDNRHTRTGNLSGGQKKRLAIALELVTNPPVLILDEPTSGLDSSTSNQCISLLKKLAMEGRTVICTIHQPSALTFKMFDHLYAIAEGKCIYTGGTDNLVPFLAEAGLECPESYNPADYLMEIATDDYGKQNHKLVLKIENGRNVSYRQTKAAKKAQAEALSEINYMMDAGLITPVTAPALSASPPVFPQQAPDFSQSLHNRNYQQSQKRFKPLTPIEETSSNLWDSGGLLSDNDFYTKDQQQPATTSDKATKKPKIQIDPAKLCNHESIYATPFYRQLYYLLVRTFLILWRDSSLTTLRFVIHFVTALLIGFLYYNIGNDAGNALNNFRYVFYTIMFIMYCAFSSIIVKFPLEYPIVSREHFNRWYSLRAYYVAMTLADIPIQIICTSLFILTSYYMTGQPWELFRLALFSLIVFLTALVAQSIGLIVGASLSVQFGAILGPFFICPFLTFSGFFLQHKDAPIYLKWLFHVSFLRYSLDGAMLALFGYDRPRLHCKDMYCHYSHPQFFLKDLDMTNANYEFATIFLIVLFLSLRILAFYIISFRLRIFR